MIQHYTVKDRMFKCEYQLYCNGSAKEFTNAVKPYFADLSRFNNCDNVAGLTVVSDNGSIIIYMPTFNTVKINDIGTLTHECVHAMQLRLWEKCGVSETEWEVASYFVEFLVTGFLNEINKKKAVKRRKK